VRDQVRALPGRGGSARRPVMWVYVMSELYPASHDNKDVRQALESIFERQPGEWFIVKASHWGTLRCRSGCCSIPVYHTPKNASNHARRIERDARRHPLTDGDPRSRRRE